MILVTGATGLVGSHLLYELCRNNKKVRALYRNKSRIDKVKHVFGYYEKDSSALFSKIEWIKADILNRDDLNKAVKNCNLIYHCAAIVSFNPQKREETVQLNLQMTKNIVDAAIENSVFDFCHVSSIATLGRLGADDFVDETAVFNHADSHSAYSIGKFKAEEYVLAAQERGLKALIIKPSVIIGPGWWQEGSGKFFSQVYKSMPYYTSGKTAFVDVRDVVQATAELVEKGIRNDTFIISAENISYKDFFSKIATSLNKKPPYIKIPMFLSELIWPIAELVAYVSGKEPILNRYTARTSQKSNQFTGEKLEKRLNFKHRDIDTSIKEYGAFFLKDIREKSDFPQLLDNYKKNN